MTAPQDTKENDEKGVPSDHITRSPKVTKQNLNRCIIYRKRKNSTEFKNSDGVLSGDAGTRTLVQTKQLNAFYMFIFCSDFRNWAGTEAHGAFILSSVVSDCDRSISLT